MFGERRQRVREAMGPDAIAVFLGAKLAKRSNDTDYRFRQDSDFWYLTGFRHPNAIALCGRCGSHDQAPALPALQSQDRQSPQTSHPTSM